MKILVTGAAGFIGFHLCDSLLKQGFEVVGIDNINDYYDVKLKYDRLSAVGIKKDYAKVFMNKTQSESFNNFHFIRVNLEDKEGLTQIFQDENFDMICNLAAQAGVRYSLKNPQTYIDSNIQGFLNILECCKLFKIKRLVYASSSSVYGMNDSVPFKESDSVDNPISLYAATKKSNELMAYTYSHLYGIQTIGLRFFTVYGPWGRPDMAMFLFTKAALERKSIEVYNNGDMARDFTYIDDIIRGIKSTLLTDSKKNEAYQLYNIGNNSPVKLLDFIECIENSLSLKIEKKYLPIQKGDVYRTWADVSKLIDNYNYNPLTPIEKGVNEFVTWYKEYYNID